MRCIFSESGGTISESSVSLRMLMAKPWLLGHSERRRARRLRSGRALKGCCRSTLAPAHYILPPVRWGACEANLKYPRATERNNVMEKRTRYTVDLCYLGPNHHVLLPARGGR